MDALLEPVDTLRGWRADLTSVDPTTDSDAVAVLRALEELKAAAAAAQARITVGFDTRQRRAQRAAGMTADKVGAGIGAQIGLARRESPTMGARHLGLAHALVEELPHTLRALACGETTEWRATIIARESACLTREHRLVLDAELAGRTGALAALGDRGVQAAARTIAYRLDPAAFTARAAHAASGRRVSIRPAPDTMVWLGALLPVRHGIAAYAALTSHADTTRATGDPRTRGQVMADTLVERLTGHAHADHLPLEVQLVMTDQSLLNEHPTWPHQTPTPGDATPASDTPAGQTPAPTPAGGTDADETPVGGPDPRDTPAHVPGYGPVPAPLARAWIRDSTAEVWIRRLHTHPRTGQLVAMDSTRRAFTGKLRDALIIRDQHCRTPWCGAPIRHIDHAVRAADHGPTNAANGQGLCEACNHAKEAPGWHTDLIGDTVRTRTPTGHQVTSRPPPLAPPTQRITRMELYLHDLVLVA